jgi:hypothetical protein
MVGYDAYVPGDHPMHAGYPSKYVFFFSTSYNLDSQISVDGPFAQEISWVIELTMVLGFRLLAVVSLTPSFLFPGALVGVVGGWVGRIYMKAQLSIKREMSNAKAPVLGHFSAAIAGLSECRWFSFLSQQHVHGGT